MKDRAIYTVQHNEQYYLPMWVKYYLQTFAPEDIYIVSHNCFGKTRELLDKYKEQGINIVDVETDTIFDHDYLLNQVHTSQRNLLKEYKYVVFTDCDEIIVPKTGTLKEFLENATEQAYRCTGYDVIGDKMIRSPGFDKTLISSIPLTYIHGYHTAIPEFPVCDDLEMYHIHKLNYQEAWERNQRISQEKWDNFAVTNKLSWQNRIDDEESFKELFYCDKERFVEQSDNLKKLVEYITE